MAVLTFIILSFVFLMLFVIERQTTKGVFPRYYLFLFTGLWFIDMLLAVIDIIDVGGISEGIYVVITAGVICYIVGFLLSNKGKVLYQSEQTYIILDNKIGSFIKSPITFIVYLGALLLTIYEIIIVLPQLILAGNLSGGLRVEAMTGQLYSPLFYLAKDFLLSPLYSIAITVLPYVIIRGQYFWRSLPCCLYVIAFPMLTGGRMGYAIIVLMFVAVYFWFLSSKQLIRKNIKRVAIISSVSALFLFSFMTVIKRGDVLDIKGSLIDQQEENSFLKETSAYFVGPLKAFEYAIDHGYQERLGGMQYGRATLAALDQYVNPIVNKMNGRKDPNENTRVGKIIQEEIIYLGPGITSWNALYTASLHFYLDFGYLGCLFFPLLFGYWTGSLTKRVVRSKKVSTFFLLFFVVRMSLSSMLSFYPVEGDVIPFFIIIFVIYIFESTKINVRKSPVA